MSASITLNNVTLSYDRHPAVHHLSGTFSAGSCTAIAGPNGAGKSTLLKAIAGLIKPDDGSITINGDGSLAYLPQLSELQRDFPMTLLAMVCTGYWNRTGGSKSITPTMQEHALHVLAHVGLAGLEGRNLSSLSTGQFQRALFARLTVQNASLILLDEPFAAVDADTTETLLHIIQHWHREGRTILCVTHDFNQIRTHFPQCLLLARECIGWGKSTDILTPELLTNARFFQPVWSAQPEICGTHKEHS